MLASATVSFSGRMGVTSVYEGLNRGGGGWGKRDDSVYGTKSIPIYTCDKETGYVTARERMCE